MKKEIKKRILSILSENDNNYNLKKLRKNITKSMINDNDNDNYE